MSNLFNKITDKLSGDHHQHKEEKEQQQQQRQQEQQYQQQQRGSQGMPQRSQQGTSVQSDDYNTGYTSGKTESAYNPMMESQGQNEPSGQQWTSGGGTTMGSKMGGYHDDTHADDDDFGEYSSNRQQQQTGWGSSGQAKSRPGMVHESREDALENQRGPFPEDEENEDDDGDQYGRHNYMQSRQGQRQQNMGQRMQRGAQRGSNYMSDDM